MFGVVLFLGTVAIVSVVGWSYTGLKYLNKDHNHRLQLKAKDSIIQDMAEALVDADTPELRLLGEGEEWALEMSPEDQRWKVKVAVNG